MKFYSEGMERDGAAGGVKESEKDLSRQENVRISLLEGS